METRMVNAPNVVTGIGILAIFIYISGYLSDNIYLTLAALLTAGASDALDGWLARLLHQETFVGILLDKTRDILLFSAIAGNLLLIKTPGTMFLLKIMIASEMVWLAITFAAPASNIPHKRSDHLFNKIRQGAYLLIIAFVTISRQL